MDKLTIEDVMLKYFDCEEMWTGHELGLIKEAMTEWERLKCEPLNAKVSVLVQINYDLTKEVRDLKKLCKIASVPKILIEYPSLLNRQTTTEDLKWANGVLRRYINEI